MAKEPTLSDATQSMKAVGRSGTKVLKSLALVAADKLLGTVQTAAGSGRVAVRQVAKQKSPGRKSRPAKRRPARPAKKTARKVKSAAKRSVKKTKRAVRKAKRTVKRTARKAKRAGRR